MIVARDLKELEEMQVVSFTRSFFVNTTDTHQELSVLVYRKKGKNLSGFPFLVDSAAAGFEIASPLTRGFDS